MDGHFRQNNFRRRHLLVAVLWLLFSLAGNANAIEPKSRRDRQSPAPVRVVQFSYHEPDGSRIPVVEVFSNGVVKAIDSRKTEPRGEHSTVTDRLSEEELQELHDLLFQQCQIAELTSEGIMSTLESASRQRQLRADINGAAATEIGLLVGTRWHVVNCPAVSILATRFPEITEIQQISIAQNRLQNIAAVALVGGRDFADRHAATATQRLHEEHPESGQLTRHDLTMVRFLPNGGQLMQFRYAGSPGQNDGCLVCVTKSPLGLTRVSLMESPSVIR